MPIFTQQVVTSQEKSAHIAEDFSACAGSKRMHVSNLAPEDYLYAEETAGAKVAVSIPSGT